MRRKNVFIVGNCQASAIANLYRNFVGLPNYESVTYFDDHMIAPEVTRAAVAEADLVIVQDRDFNHGISQAQLRADATVVNFPMVLAGFIWPHANEAHVSNVPEPPFSDGPYPSQLSDSFLNRLILKGATPEQALEEYLALDIARVAHLDRMSEIYFAKQRDRDRRTGFDVAPQIEQRFRSEALFRTPHHPNAPLFGAVASQVFERLGVPGDVIEAALRSLRTTPFPPDELPIHPGVIRHFGLTFADETTRYSYFDEGRFTFAEYVLRYMRYENNHALRLGIATAETTDPSAVLALLDEGLAQSPESMRGWRARGIALDRLGRHADACEAFQRAIDVDPGSPEGLIALSISHRMAGEHDAAHDAAERAVALAPSYYLSHRVLAEAQMAIGASSTDAAHRAVQLLPSATNLHLLGLATAASGGLELAEDAARRLLAMDPTSPDARNLLAETLEDRSRRAEAIAVLNEGVALGVENGQTYSLLGNFHWRDGALDAAEAAFSRGSELEPARTDLLKCRDDVRAQRASASEPEPALEAPVETPAPDAAPAPTSPNPVRVSRPTTRRLTWLPPIADWAARIGAVERMQPGDPDAWASVVALARHDLDFVRTTRLDQAIRRLCSEEAAAGLDTAPVRLAVLGSSTVDHLLPAIRVAAARRGVRVETYVPAYGQFRQEILDPESGLYASRPTTVLFALDARHLLQGADLAMDHAAARAFTQTLLDDLAGLWSTVRTAFRAQILQNAILPVFPTVLGLNEQRLPGSPAALVRRLTVELADAADSAGVELVAIDQWAAQEGIKAWHDPVLWHRAKQDISPIAAPVYGDLVARLIAAARGLSGKCLVLDLDNTLWGGVVGDDGPDGIVIGHGSAAGEAFAAFQSFARALRDRGVLLAVCSKNDAPNARAAFEQNPDMVLKLGDFSAFVANWDDKASNLREIARQLNIGLDALVFVDDNPFERNLVRRELPAVHVPEMPDEPAAFAATLSNGGYFEALSLTAEDRDRTLQYEANRARAADAAGATDMASYLRGLDMRLLWKPIDQAGLRRATQLINKTNQFNLTTRRYSEEEVAATLADPNRVGLQLRLLDRFGDNGVIAVVLGRLADHALEIESWLMSCRVLGRQVEQATFAILVAEANRRGATTILGRYRPTAKNGMVADLLPKLGFSAIGEDGDDQLYRIDTTPPRFDLPMTIEKDSV